MKRRQLAVAAAFAAVVLLSLLLVRPRGPAVAPRPSAAPTASASPAGARLAAAPTPGAPAATKGVAARPKTPRATGLSGTLRVSPAPAASAEPAPAAEPATAVASAAPAAPQAEGPLDPRLTGAVSGEVRDDRGHVIAGTTVLAVSAGGEDAAETTTDDDGAFLVAGLRPGRYALFAGLGTPVASRIAGRGVEVRPAAVTRVDLFEPAEGTLVRVAPQDARGRPAEAQAVLVAGAPSASGAVGSLLASDAIYLPELGGGRTLLPRVPPGVYTLVLLRGAGVPVRAARDPVRISRERELVVKIEVASAAVPRG